MPASTSAKNCGAGETHFPSGKMLIKKMIHCNVALLGGSASMVSCGLLARCRSRAMAAGFLVSALRSAGTDHPARRRRARLVWRRERADALSHGIRLVVRAAMAAMLATWCCPRPCAWAGSADLQPVRPGWLGSGPRRAWLSGIFGLCASVGLPVPGLAHGLCR